MATIDDLAVSITEMTSREALDLVLELRADRRVVKIKPKAKKQAASKRKTFKTMFDQLTEAQKAEILKQLQFVADSETNS